MKAAAGSNGGWISTFWPPFLVSFFYPNKSRKLIDQKRGYWKLGRLKSQKITYIILNNPEPYPYSTDSETSLLPFTSNTCNFETSQLESFFHLRVIQSWIIQREWNIERVSSIYAHF